MATITTIFGDMEESALEKREGVVDNENEHTTWVEYWLPGELAVARRRWAAEHPGEMSNGGEMTGYVHRSAHVVIKKPVNALSAIESF